MDGRLGVGNDTTLIAPGAVIGDHVFIECMAGYAFSCCLANNGSIWCFGSNAYGQLGNGMPIDSSEPVRVDSDIRFLALTTGEDYACALAAYQPVYLQVSGKLGQASTAHFLQPACLYTQPVSTKNPFVCSTFPCLL